MGGEHASYILGNIQHEGRYLSPQYTAFPRPPFDIGQRYGPVLIYAAPVKRWIARHDDGLPAELIARYVDR